MLVCSSVSKYSFGILRVLRKGIPFIDIIHTHIAIMTSNLTLHCLSLFTRSCVVVAAAFSVGFSF